MALSFQILGVEGLLAFRSKRVTDHKRKKLLHAILNGLFLFFAV